jgi:glutamyl-Q tRNA(Asp) synthetase
MGDALRRIVCHHGELICPGSVGAPQHEVAHRVRHILRLRADGPWAYQLAVVADDAAQGVTHVVRGEDLADNTARQIVLQGLLALPTPLYLHTPLVRDAQGRKLSKSNGAPALETSGPAAALREALRHLALPPITGATAADLLPSAVAAWSNSHGISIRCLPLSHNLPESPPCPPPPPAA